MPCNYVVNNTNAQKIVCEAYAHGSAHEYIDDEILWGYAYQTER